MTLTNRLDEYVTFFQETIAKIRRFYQSKAVRMQMRQHKPRARRKQSMVDMSGKYDDVVSPELLKGSGNPTHHSHTLQIPSYHPPMSPSSEAPQYQSVSTGAVRLPAHVVRGSLELVQDFIFSANKLCTHCLQLTVKRPIALWSYWIEVHAANILLWILFYTTNAFKRNGSYRQILIAHWDRPTTSQLHKIQDRTGIFPHCWFLACDLVQQVGIVAAARQLSSTSLVNPNTRTNTTVQVLPVK